MESCMENECVKPNYTINYCKNLMNKSRGIMKEGHQMLNVPLRSSREKAVCEEGVFKNFANFIGEHLCQSLFFNKTEGLRPATLFKKKLWHRQGLFQTFVGCDYRTQSSALSLFSFEMVKNDICLGGASKQNAVFFRKCALKSAPMPPMSRIGPDRNFHVNFLKLLRTPFFIEHLLVATENSKSTMNTLVISTNTF